MPNQEGRDKGSKGRYPVLEFVASPRAGIAVVLLTLAMALFIPLYGIFEPVRMEAAKERQLNQSLVRAVELYNSNCALCHGRGGQGGPGYPGPKLDRPDLRPTDPVEIRRTADRVRKVIARGRGIMSAWALEEGGPYNQQQIEDLTNLTLYGDWGKVAEAGPAVVPTPTPRVFATPALPPGATPAPVSVAGDPSVGKELFTAKGCGGCHVIQGLSSGTAGPELTHIATRPYDGLPNDPAFLSLWLKDPASQKPDTTMPNLGLSDKEIENLVAFLMTLK